MFEESLLESTPLLRTRNRWPTLISLATQAALVAALIAIPMLHPEIVQMNAPKLFFLAPPPRPVPPPPPPGELVHVTMANTPTAPTTPTMAPPPNAPRLFPSTTSIPAEAPPNFNNVGIMTDASSHPFSSVPTGTTTRVVPVPANAGRSTSPINVSRGVIAGLLIAPIQPVYPPIARAARLGGTVIVQAIISKSGQIEAAHIISGPAMLQSAAIEAVRNARYHPFLLNGEPTEVQTTISINFQLGG